MKLTNKLQFGFNAVQSGQKAAVVNATPTLTVNSTEGKFTISGPVSKALDIAVSQNIALANNIDEIEKAIAAKDENILAAAQELGVDINTYEGHQALVAELTQWAIYKGVAKYNRLGQPIMVAERMSKEDKEKFISEHAMEIVEQNRAELIARVGDEDASDEDLVAAIDVKDIPSPTTQDYTGSRCATTSNATGVGVALQFTDSGNWNMMKSDLETKTSVNRIFDVDLSNPIKVKVNNGKEDLLVDGYVLVFKEDAKPLRVGAKKEAAE